METLNRKLGNIIIKDVFALCVSKLSTWFKNDVQAKNDRFTSAFARQKVVEKSLVVHKTLNNFWKCRVLWI